MSPKFECRTRKLAIAELFTNPISICFYRFAWLIGRTWIRFTEQSTGLNQHLMSVQASHSGPRIRVTKPKH